MLVKLAIKSAAISASILVAGCGGSSLSVDNPGTNGLPYAQTGDAADTATLIDSGLQISTKSSQAAWASNGANFTPSTDTPTAQVRIVSATEVEITINGKTWTLTPSTSAGSGPTGTDVTVFTATNGLTQLEAIFGRAATGTNFQSIFFGFLSETDLDTVRDSYFVTGLETDPTMLANRTETTASYTGPARMTTRGTNGTAISTPPIDVLSSATGANLTVNFQTGKINGTLSGSADAALGGNEVVLRLDEADLSSNGFSTTFTRDASSTNNDIAFTGTNELTGTFFGVGGEELGGTFASDITKQTGSTITLPEDTVGTGYFISRE